MLYYITYFPHALFASYSLNGYTSRNPLKLALKFLATVYAMKIGRHSANCAGVWGSSVCASILQYSATWKEQI